MTKHTCPRRHEAGLPGLIENADAWTKEQTCTWCGSLNPDVFMEVCRGTMTGVLGPTDKSYKVYLDDLAIGHRKFYLQHLTPEQRHEFIDLYNTRPRRRYDDSMEFTQDDGEGMQVGYPGYFYVMPFFAEQKPVS